MEEVEIILKSGYVFIAKYKEADFDEIYERYFNNEKRINLENGVILISEIAAIKWEVRNNTRGGSNGKQQALFSK